MIVQDEGQLSEHFMKLRSVEHPHICKFREAYKGEETVHLVYEKAEPKSLLFDEKLPMQEQKAREYTRQIAMAISVAHSMRMIHGKIRPSTIIKDPTSGGKGEVKAVKVCDF